MPICEQYVQNLRVHNMCAGVHQCFACVGQSLSVNGVGVLKYLHTQLKRDGWYITSESSFYTYRMSVKNLHGKQSNYTLIVRLCDWLYLRMQSIVNDVHALSTAVYPLKHMALSNKQVPLSNKQVLVFIQWSLLHSKWIR